MVSRFSTGLTTEQEFPNWIFRLILVAETQVNFILCNGPPVPHESEEMGLLEPKSELPFSVLVLFKAISYMIISAYNIYSYANK